jgi:cytochrome o ubiquinol oxidase subunit 3
MSNLNNKLNEENSSKVTLGFWIYLMTDLVIFACLFAVYAVLHKNTNGGPSAGELFSLPYVFVETMLLLTSSFVAGLAMLSARQRDTSKTLLWLFVTFLLGIAFVGMEIAEFSNLVKEGYSWKASAFLSSFFTLVGTHGIHITIGLIWLAVLVVMIVKKGLTNSTVLRLTLFSLFWHLLDIVWIFIFSFVYLMGAVSS